MHSRITSQVNKELRIKENVATVFERIAQHKNKKSEFGKDGV